MFSLETTRLKLREWTIADLDIAFAIYSDKEVMKYIGNGDPYTNAQTENGLNLTIQHYQKYGYGAWPIILKQTGEIIGHCGLKYWERFGEVELGYLLKSEFWGQGYASEAAQAVLNYAFGELNLYRLVAYIYPGNLPSKSLIQKIGFTFECRMNWDSGGVDIVDVYSIHRQANAALS